MTKEKAINILKDAIEKMDARPYLTGDELNVSFAMQMGIDALERSEVKE